MGAVETLPYADRVTAGRALGALLADRDLGDRPLVLGLPRGGVPVAAEVAKALGGELDVLVVRKLGAPGRPELAVGAIAGDVEVRNDSIVGYLGVTEEELERIARTERVELGRREREYRGDRPRPRLDGRVVVLVDDGLATGASMRVAVVAARAGNPARVVVAAPVGAAPACHALREVADEVVCAAMPEPFDAVGRWYADFSPTSDAEVRDLLTVA